MKKTRFLTWVGTGLLTASVLLCPVTTPVAQTPTPDTRAPAPQVIETRTDDDHTGLWGLLGLVGLLGLAGLRRRHGPDPVAIHTPPRDRSKV